MSREKSKAPNAHKDRETKQRAVAAYAATGSYEKAASIVGLHQNTIRYWAKQEWFQEELLRADRADTEELKSTFTRIAKRATEELEDRINNGEEVVTKDGSIVRRKISAKDAALVSAISVDKRKILLETPQTVAIQSTNEKLLNLMEQFIRFNKAKEIVYDREDKDGVSGKEREGQKLVEIELKPETGEETSPTS